MRICIGFNDGYDVSNHILLRICSIDWLDFREVRTMPYFGNMVVVHADTVLVNFEWPDNPGQSVESIKCLVIQMQDIREGHVHYVGQSDRNFLGIEIG